MDRTQVAPGVYLNDIPGGKFKRSLMVAHLILPAVREKANERALLPHVLERRCEAIQSPLALSRRLFDLYGADLAAESYIAGSNWVFSIAVSGLKNEYALAGEDVEKEYVRLLYQLLFRPKLSAAGVFEEEDVQIERSKQIDYLRSEMNDKRSYCLRQARRALFGNTPLGIESPGYLDEMPGVTPEGLYKAYREMVETATLEVYTCGLDKDMAARELADFMGAENRAPQPMAGRTVVEYPGSFIQKSEAMDTAQGKLCIMATSEGKRDAHGEAVMRVANAVLGGLATSRLFVNVREKQSLCYYCASSYAPLRGVLTMDSGVEHANAEKAAAAMLAEFEQLQKEPVTGEELAAAHLAIKNVYSAAQDGPDSIVNWAFNEHLRGTNLSLDKMVEEVQKVTAEEVQAAFAAFKPAIQYVITKQEGV